MSRAGFARRVLTTHHSPLPRVARAFARCGFTHYSLLTTHHSPLLRGRGCGGGGAFGFHAGDARVGRYFALSPELYLSWHPVPNGAGLPDDNFWSTGLRLNFLWYSPAF